MPPRESEKPRAARNPSARIAVAGGRRSVGDAMSASWCRLACRRDFRNVGKRPKQPHHAPPFLPAYASCRSEETLAIPGYRQARNYSCGFATALMVARYYRPDVNARRLFEQLGTGRDGTRQNAIVKVLRAQGLGANVRYDVGFERLRQEILRGKLVVGYLHDSEHWVLLYGYGLAPRRVFIADPEPGVGCVKAWERYADRLRAFGIVCSYRQRSQPEEAIVLEERRAEKPRQRVPEPPQDAPGREPAVEPLQLSFGFMRRR